MIIRLPSPSEWRPEFPRSKGRPMKAVDETRNPFGSGLPDARGGNCRRRRRLRPTRTAFVQRCSPRRSRPTSAAAPRSTTRAPTPSRAWRRTRPLIGARTSTSAAGCSRSSGCRSPTRSRFSTASGRPSTKTPARVVTRPTAVGGRRKSRVTRWTRCWCGYRPASPMAWCHRTPPMATSSTTGRFAGVTPEARAIIDYEEIAGAYGDGTPYTLLRPRLELRRSRRSARSTQALTSPRVAPAVIGLGLLEAVPEATLTALADPDDADGDGISGRINRLDGCGHGRPLRLEGERRRPAPPDRSRRDRRHGADHDALPRPELPAGPG